MIGLRITQPAAPDSEAERVGLFKDDCITLLENQKLESVDHLIELMAAHENESVVLEVFRKGQLFHTTVRAGVLGLQLAAADIAQEYRKAVASRKRKTLEPHVQNVVLTTAQSVEGCSVAKTLDIVSAECVFGINIITDIVSEILDITGGRNEGMQMALREAKQNCLMELRRKHQLWMLTP